ncbi:pentatricopeptide repeat domain-containing protein 3, mitochondrial [Poeciliopsis prolifica]|uniref:pentatricopeptide repeat domain-containing protein 3, mitochondrial n=1 Tax=Poeciliopsis prolifica TaxID=188132 RepID=UPI0024135684|nr:pentatricopeptide repeat domain-containing protein 3, mitochondrial [Poeciliopsis prolifica]
MAAPCKHVGQHIHRNGRFLRFNIDQLFASRSFGRTSALQQQATDLHKESKEAIVIPRKKSWSKEAVLEALASTVQRDPTAYPYQFQDDSYLSPRTSAEFNLFSLSQESGRAAAKYFVNCNPKLFTKDFAEPHIPCLMPESVAPCLEEVSEAALEERISLRKVSAAVEMYDQLQQSGTAVSMETTHKLLDLICLYCDKEPVQEWGPKTEAREEAGDKEGRRWKPVGRRLTNFLKLTWKDNNNAERIFNLLPERDARCYSALIRGMVKHGAHAKAFNMYADLLNNRLSADVHIFNALISAVPDVKEKFNERWDLIDELLNQMKEQKVHPNLLTFNSVLKALRRCGFLAKTFSPQTLNEMKALGIAPSLATYEHILAVFSKPASSGPSSMDVLQNVLTKLEGTSFTCQDPDDVLFFSTAMKMCLDGKDLELGYKVHSLVEVGENCRLLGDSYQRGIYYGRFFSLLCMMEHIDVVLKWYNRIVPSLHYPNPPGMKSLLQALDTDSRLDLLPTIWKDIKTLGHDNKLNLVEDLLSLMAREEHSVEVQESFAACALDIKRVFDERPGMEWRTSSLSQVSILLLRANKFQKAWDMLQLFKGKSRVPSGALLSSFLTACRCNASPQRAVELVQLSAAFGLPTTPELAKRTLAEFELDDKQRSIVSEFEAAPEKDD